MEQSKESKMTVFEYLNLRTEWEELAQGFMLEDEMKQGTMDNIRCFILDGYKGNRFRKGFDRAIEIANEILERK